MEIKNYLLVARGTTTGALEKTNVMTNLDDARRILTLMMDTSSRINYGEIIDGRQTHTGDFSVKPVYSIRREANGECVEQFYNT